MKHSNEYLKSMLTEHDIKPSTIRIKVLDYMLNNRIHPTVEDIYKELINEIPTLSKTSIYNTLDIFVKNKLVYPLSTGEKELRYDIDTCCHGHFICEECKEVYDFHLPDDFINNLNLEDYYVKSKNINLNGICKKCIEKNKGV